jgi:hypothetical protein
MPTIYKTRIFQRWFSKTELDDAALIAAITEVQSGLVEAELGQGLYKNDWHYQDGVKAAGFARLLPVGFRTHGFLCSVLKRTPVPISRKKNCKLCKHWHKKSHITTPRS